MTDQEKAVIRKALSRLGNPELFCDERNNAYVMGLLDALLCDERSKLSLAQKIGIVK